jgi:hypothetical protein
MALFPEDFNEKFPRPVDTYHRKSYDRIAPATLVRQGFRGEGKTLLITGGGIVAAEFSSLEATDSG